MKERKKQTKSDFYSGAGPAYTSPFLIDMRKVLVREDSVSVEDFNDFVAFGYLFAYQYIPMEHVRQVTYELMLADKLADILGR